jgi:hypothetical protein
MNRILIILVALFTMGTAANATTLAAGGIFARRTQNTANCVLYNASDSVVTVLDSQIDSTFVTRVPTAFNDCHGALGPHNICNIQANIANNVVFGCKVLFSPDGARVRGVFSISNSPSPGVINVLQNVELR